MKKVSSKSPILYFNTLNSAFYFFLFWNRFPSVTPLCGAPSISLLFSFGCLLILSNKTIEFKTRRARSESLTSLRRENVQNIRRVFDDGLNIEISLFSSATYSKGKFIFNPAFVRKPRGPCARQRNLCGIFPK